MGDKTGPVGPNIRKSCQFCRSRKMRCSGGRICDTCRVRSIDCIYGREGSKGRPRLDKTRDKRSSPMNGTPPVSSSSERDRASTSPRPTWGLSDYPFQSTIGLDLEVLFNLQFDGPNGEHKPTVLQRQEGSAASSANNIHWDYAQGAMISDLGTGGPRKQRQSVNYEDLFFSVGHSMIESFSTIFGSLGFTPTLSPHTWISAERFFDDPTTAMFDTPAGTRYPDPVPTDDHHARQLIELWFAHHPLSVLLSKTILLSQLRNGTIDKYLLATILAGASYILGKEFHANGQELTNWVLEGLRQEDPESYDLAKVQTLMILGWHELCYHSARKARIFFQEAIRAITHIEPKLQAQSEASSDYINGVLVSSVESELVQRIYWFCIALALWSAIQFRKGPWLEDPKVPLPPLDSETSAIIALDIASGNVATLQIQKRLVRLLWPICHITSTLLPLYQLHPTIPFQPREIALMRYKMTPSLDMDAEITSVCQAVSSTLTQVVEELDARENSTHVAVIFVRTAYRIVLLHLLFPRGQSPDYVAVETLQSSLRSIIDYKQIVLSAEKAPPTEYGIIDTPKRCNETMFGMGMDSVARILQRLVDACELASGLYYSTWCAHSGDIQVIARDFMVACQHPRLQIASGLQDVKEIFAKVNVELRSMYDDHMARICGDASLCQVPSLESQWQVDYGLSVAADDIQFNQIWNTTPGNMGSGWTPLH